MSGPHLEFTGKRDGGAEIACRVHIRDSERAQMFLVKLVEAIKEELKFEAEPASSLTETAAGLQAPETGESSSPGPSDNGQSANE